jgi:uncharacterized protein (TIGR02246 family)
MRTLVLFAVVALMVSAAQAQDAHPFANAWNAGDSQAVAAMFAANAVVVGPDGGKLEGRDAIHSDWLSFSVGVPITLAVYHMQVVNGANVEVGRYSSEGRGNSGTYVTISEQHDGEWLITMVSLTPFEQ